MDQLRLLMPVIIYILLAVLIVAIIALIIKAINTLKKVDKVVDDINDKSSKLDGLFSIIDGATSTIESVNDKIAGAVLSGIKKVFKKKEGK